MNLLLPVLNYSVPLPSAVLLVLVGGPGHPVLSVDPLHQLSVLVIVDGVLAISYLLFPPENKSVTIVEFSSV